MTLSNLSTVVSKRTSNPDNGRPRLDNCRLLIYSHDTFGLGHLRRCRTIAHALVERYKGLSILILTGSAIAGRFDFKARVDFVRLPGVIKLHNGDYTPLSLHIKLSDTMKLRESIILNTAQAYAPDIFLVDKEPLGLKGEVKSTLEMFKDTPSKTILGLRDVMDDPKSLRQEWDNKKVWPALENLYDELWVYGSQQMGNPLESLPVSAKVRDKMIFTGYLKRKLPKRHDRADFEMPPQPYILVTPGGGGDGIEMVDWVLRAYEARADRLLTPAVFVLGPFMPTAKRNKFMKRAEALPNVSMITFDAQMEHLMDNAAAVVAMGGYNTFCEILSFNRPSLILPRRKPRKEQLIRAQNAVALGLISMLDFNDKKDTDIMVEALRSLTLQSEPSNALVAGSLDGLKNVVKRFGRMATKVA
jgi:predicted glycosyltransferase